MTELILNIDGKIPESRERRNINQRVKLRADLMLYRNVPGRPSRPVEFEGSNSDKPSSISLIEKVKVRERNIRKKYFSGYNT
ncbi:Hypothetical protein CINCED_3A014750 [Cinara cedri]|uniref:Uncharacterized protein n=1 Tax=Cinara cedri TaxID=506608 RepID=A0A5E4MEN8_9HEMI|nr:Hypothetical protein CINCED_3A014750 [Cinara cedri]